MLRPVPTKQHLPRRTALPRAGRVLALRTAFVALLSLASAQDTPPPAPVPSPPGATLPELAEAARSTAQARQFWENLSLRLVTLEAEQAVTRSAPAFFGERHDELAAEFARAFQAGANDASLLALHQELRDLELRRDAARATATDSSALAHLQRDIDTTLAQRAQARTALSEALAALLPAATAAARLESERLRARLDPASASPDPTPATSAPPLLTAVRIRTGPGKLVYEASWDFTSPPEPLSALVESAASRLQHAETLRDLWGDLARETEADAAAWLDLHEDETWRRLVLPLLPGLAHRTLAAAWSLPALQPLAPGRILALRHPPTSGFTSRPPESWLLADQPLLAGDPRAVIRHALDAPNAAASSPAETLSRIESALFPFPPARSQVDASVSLEPDAFRRSFATLLDRVENVSPLWIPEASEGSSDAWLEFARLERARHLAASAWEAAWFLCRARSEVLLHLLDARDAAPALGENRLVRRRDEPIRIATSYRIQLEFSLPVTVTSVSLAGRTATATTLQGTTWQGEVTSPAPLHHGLLEVHADTLERVPRGLDDPRTTARPPGTSDGRWQAYEEGSDRNHSLRLDSKRPRASALLVLGASEEPDGFDAPRLSTWLASHTWEPGLEFAVVRAGTGGLEWVHGFTTDLNRLRHTLETGSVPLQPLSPSMISEARRALERHARGITLRLGFFAGTPDDLALEALSNP